MCILAAGLSVLLMSLPLPALAAGPIETGLRSELRKKVLHEREIHSAASLRDAEADGRRSYSFLTVMQVSAPVARVRDVLTDYALYEKLIPYVSKSRYDPKKKTLEVEGGLWNYRLQSTVRFREESERRLAFEVIDGSFRGMVGTLDFEGVAERGSLVSLQGSQTGKDFPPKFLIERGAEIVFSFAGKKMRDLIEERSRQAGGSSNEYPQPQRKF